MNTAHSPLPWRVNGRDEIISSDDLCVVDNDEYQNIDAPNAALIVRAVNALEPMREALDGISQEELDDIEWAANDSIHLHRGHSRTSASVSVYEDMKKLCVVLQKAKAALALASGTTEEGK